MDRHRAGRSFQVDDVAHIDFGHVFGAKTADPLIFVVVLIDDWPVMAAGQNTERSLIGGAVEDVGAGGARAIIGVRPKGNVLMPLHLVAAL